MSGEMSWLGPSCMKNVLSLLVDILTRDICLTKQKAQMPLDTGKSCLCFSHLYHFPRALETLNAELFLYQIKE